MLQLSASSTIEDVKKSFRKISKYFAAFYINLLLPVSDVNKDLGLKAKAKDSDPKAKAKAKDLSHKAKAKDLCHKAKAKDLDPKAKAKDLSHKAKAKDLDFGLKDQGQGLTSLLPVCDAAY